MYGTSACHGDALGEEWLMRGGPLRWMVVMLAAVLDSDPIPTFIRMAAEVSVGPSLSHPCFGGAASDQHVE